MPGQLDPFGVGLFFGSLIHGFHPRLFTLDPVPGSSKDKRNVRKASRPLGSPYG